MDQSIIVGLITGTRACPQDDLSLESKVNIILYAQSVLKKQMENLVTRHFRPSEEYTSWRSNNLVAYRCEVPTQLKGVRIGIMFSIETFLGTEHCQGVEKVLRHRVILTTKGDLFWWAEKCACEHERNGSTYLVEDVEVIQLDTLQLTHYLETVPELFLKLLTNFRSVAETAFNMRKQRQESTKDVLDELTRINNMVDMAKFV